MWGVTAVVAVSLASSVYQAEQEKKAKKDAEKQAKKDRADALRAEQFADTEGEGQGMLGNISLAVDDEVDSEVLSGNAKVAI